ncbi:hypothetical protein JW962_00200 [Candidatus Dojkabacteria bacterium]|nr:hypothetical protein [Candidatus Dojkabacteria bacterium]
MENKKNLIFSILGIILVLLLGVCGEIGYISYELIRTYRSSEYAELALKSEKKTDPNNIIAVPTTPEELRAGFMEVAEQTSKLRELPYNESDVLFQFISESELRAKMESEDPSMEEDAGLGDDDLLWKAFRVIPYEMNLTEVLKEYYTQEVLGFYDQTESKFYIVSDIPKLTLDNKVTISHEFTHFLQDKAFNFDAIEATIDPMVEGNEDIYQAYLALVEGDATLTMFFYLQSLGIKAYEEYLSDIGSSDIDIKIPRIIEESIGFQYNSGMLFTLWLYQETYDFSLINAAFSNIPSSTEQILHPEKYLGADRDDPTPVTITASELSIMETTLGTGFRQVYTKYSIGELDTMLILQDFMDDEIAKEAAAGWDGNATAFYLKDETHEYSIYWKSVWDSVSEAHEFLDAIDIYTEEAGHSSVNTKLDGTVTHVLIYGDLN